MASRKQRRLTPAQTKEFFDTYPDLSNINNNQICEMFSYVRGIGIKYYVDDVITIGPGHSQYVKPDTVTTIGLYIANKYLYEDLGVFGYINKPINGHVNSTIDKHLAMALKLGEITPSQISRYFDKAQFIYGGPLALIINTSLSESIMSLPPESKKLLKTRLAENKELIDANDPAVAAKIETEVTAHALSIIEEKNDPSLVLFNSGCGVDPYNNYKTMFVMKGAVADNTGESKTGYKIATSNYDTGITKDDIPKIADGIVTGAYSRAVLTADSGTDAKRHNAIYQNARIADHGTDCKSKQTIAVDISADNKSDYVFRWIVEGGKLVMLTTENIDKYVGKTVDMRSGIHCKFDYPEYCSKCVGDRPYRIGIRNIGLTFSIIAGSTLNANMKAFHDIRIKLYAASPEDITKYVQRK